MTDSDVVNDCLADSVQFDEFFEGAEKRVSIASNINLTSIGVAQWREWIRDVGCNVLSTIENKHNIFFLLAESSFLLGKNYVMLKTCGKTKPLLILENIFENKNISVTSFKYSRPDLLKPELQFEPYNSLENEMSAMKLYSDVEISRDDKWLICQYGESHENFHELVCWKFDWDDYILEMLLEVLNQYFPMAIIDDKKFIPCGYSLNMLDDNIYLTIHVTPQTSCSYLSVEVGNIEESIANELFENIMQVINATDYRVHNNGKCNKNICDTFTNQQNMLSLS